MKIKLNTNIYLIFSISDLHIELNLKIYEYFIKLL